MPEKTYTQGMGVLLEQVAERCRIEMWDIRENIEEASYVPYGIDLWGNFVNDWLNYTTSNVERVFNA